MKLYIVCNVEFHFCLQLLLIHEIDFFIITLTLLPTFTRILLHIAHLIILVDNFQAEYRLDNILERNNALERTILVNDACQLLFITQKTIPYVGH